MNKNRVFELYAQYGWPVVRHVVRLSKRCRCCLLSERCVPLTNGLCEECRRQTGARASEHVPEASAEMKIRFDQYVRSHIRHGAKHDAVLLLSGGKDSAYILHRMRQEYPELKILCVTVNNGFMSPAAIRNVEHVAQKLKVDLLVSSAAVDQFARELREAFLNLRGRGTSGVVDHADGSLIFKVGQDIARAMDIPLVIGGLSWVQVQRIVGQEDFQRVEGSGPPMIFPLVIWRTHEQEIRRTVRDLQLTLPGSDSPLVSNSLLIMAMGIVDVLTLGYSSFEPEFAQLVREGKTDRRTWLHVFEMLEYAASRGFLDRDLREGLGRLNLSVSDVVKAEA